ncbi:Protein of unknown function [Bacillus mobilis]|nr:Protein of unknown function [Bacillus mobilis]
MKLISRSVREVSRMDRR